MKVHFARHLLRSKLLLTFALLSLLLMVTNASSSSASSSTLGATITRDSIAGKKTETEAQPESSEKTSDVVARFYLIRHGETLANLDGLVLGQTDSVSIKVW